MKIYFDQDSDILTLNSDKNYFEWCYFETDFVIGEKIHSLVIIGFNGCPFLPLYYDKNVRPTLNVVYSVNKKVQSFVFDSYETISMQNNVLKIGDNCEITYSENGSRKINLKVKDIYSQSVECELTFKPDTNKIINLPENNLADLQDGLKWGIYSMSYNVSGKITVNKTVTQIESLGYHDYNSGDKNYFLEEISEWMWWHTNREIGFELNENGIKENLILSYSEKENKVFLKKNVKQDVKFRFTNSFLRYPYEIIIFELSLKKLFHLDFTYNFLGVDYYGLFYTRYLAQVKRINAEDRGNATVEYMIPKKMKSKIIKHFLNYGLEKTEKKYGKK